MTVNETSLERHHHNMRQYVENVISFLIDQLDQIDGDPDFEEPDPDLEPYLAGFIGIGDDREGDLADSTSDLEFDEAERDYPGVITGGQGA